MAYDPTVWKSGDTITSAKLNKLENGLAEASGGGTGGGVSVLTATVDAEHNATLSCTAAELWALVQEGIVIIKFTDEIEEGMTMNVVALIYDAVYFVDAHLGGGNDYSFNANTFVIQCETGDSIVTFTTI